MNHVELGIIRAQTNNAWLNTRLDDITGYSLSRLGFGVPKYGNGIDELLYRSTKSHMLVLASGSLITDYAAIRSGLERTTAQEYLVRGHILQDKDYFHLHPQCTLFNCDTWRKLHRPAFGLGGTAPQVVTSAIRSKEDVHDDYTPRYLLPSEQSETIPATKPGWLMISESLAAGLPVNNWDDDFRKGKHYAYPNNGEAPALEHALSCFPSPDVKILDTMNWWPRQYIERLLHTWRWIANDRIYVVNTEQVIDFDKNLLAKPISSLYAVAAGLKANAMLHVAGFSEETEVRYFDFSEVALRFKRLQVEEWDGTDLGAMIEMAKAKGISNRSFDCSPEQANVWFLRFVSDIFGSLSEWVAHWNRYKLLQHHYTQCDAVKNPDSLFNGTTGIDQPVVWYSNIFDYDPGVITMGREGLCERYALFVRSARKSLSSPRLIGATPSTMW